MDRNSFWGNFSCEYHLDEAGFFGDLITVEGYKLAALNLMLPPEWREQLDRLKRVRAVHGTTAIEGNPLSEAEVDQQIGIVDGQETERNVGRISKEQFQIRNAARAQTWVRQRFEPGTPPVGLDDLMKMHQMITEGSDEEHNVPGRFRTAPVQVGSPDLGGVHFGAPPERLGELMEEFIAFLNSNRFRNSHPVTRALLAHFFLVTIHPFGDGNGRVSRLLEAGILFQGEYNVHGFYGLSNYFYKNETRYKSLLQECRQAQPFDVSPFIKFGVEGFISELSGINNFIKSKLNRVVYRQMLLENREKRLGPRRRVVNAREYDLLTFLLTETEPLDPFSENPSRQVTLWELMDSPYVTGAYRNVTRRTFVRELVRLFNAGFIKFTPGVEPTEAVIELDFDAITKYRIG